MHPAKRDEADGMQDKSQEQGLLRVKYTCTDVAMRTRSDEERKRKVEETERDAKTFGARAGLYGKSRRN